jgi:dihydropteroate synthase
MIDRGSVDGLPMRDRCLVMGVVNVAPDSFSDGGSHLETSRAVGHGLALAARGADIVDVGGESTRPGSHRVPPEEELRRVLPVVGELVAAGVVVSVDTMRSVVADAALGVGAHAINDVSGGLADPDMLRCVAQADVPYIAMHWRGPSVDMRRRAVYADVVADVVGELAARLEALADAGVDVERVVLDPGLGFAKEPSHNWELLSRLGALRSLGRPVLVGASRKSFLAELLATPGDPAPSPHVRDDATASVSALAAAAGAYCVRVHDVGSSLDAVRVAAAWSHEPRGRAPTTWWTAANSGEREVRLPATNQPTSSTRKEQMHG